jgi:hypothetical protein
VTRRIAIVIAALIVPGGLLALFGIALLRALSRTKTGRKAWGRVVDLLGRPLASVQPLRQAA